MKIYCLESDNLQIFNDHFDNLYNISVRFLEDTLNSYKQDVVFKKDVKKALILISQLESTIDQLNDEKFRDFFIKQCLNILEKVRYASVSSHSDKCITRAVFDLLFKYCMDFEYGIKHLCCDNKRFKLLQIEILRDLMWKIV
jgi:hypothetical protein